MTLSLGQANVQGLWLLEETTLRGSDFNKAEMV